METDFFDMDNDPTPTTRKVSGPLIASRRDRIRFALTSKAVRAATAITTVGAVAVTALSLYSGYTPPPAPTNTASTDLITAPAPTIDPSELISLGELRQKTRDLIVVANKTLADGEGKATPTSVTTLATAVNTATRALDSQDVNVVRTAHNELASANDQVAKETATWKAPQKPTKTPTATPTKKPSATPKPSPTATTKPTPRPTATKTATPKPTATPTKKPSATPKPPATTTARQTMTITCTDKGTATFTARGQAKTTLKAGGKTATGATQATVTVPVSAGQTITATATATNTVSLNWSANTSCH